MHEDTHARELKARRPSRTLTLTPPLTSTPDPDPDPDPNATLDPHVPAPTYDHRPDGHFPVSHTCFFSLEWPRYSSVEVARAKLLYAIANCTDMDMDQTTEGLANMAMVTTGDDDE